MARSRSLVWLAALTLAGCGMSAQGADAPGGDDDGGGVGFGGAQDLGEFRAILDRGEIPGPSTLDANGFFNEHFNAIPRTPCTGRLCLTPGLSIGKDWLTGAHQATLQISVNTSIDPSTFERLPMNLVVVVDHSGSMASDDRLVKVKAGLDVLIDNLDAGDRLAILSFDDTVTIDAPFGEALDRAKLHQVVAKLQPGGGTNIFEGLRTGLDLLGDSPASERQNRVIFLSDGLATVGETSGQAIITMATQRIMRGVGLTTIGVGDDFDVELMRGLAERGAGNFYFVEDAAAATEVFTEELDYFLTPIALDLQVDATAATGWDFGDVTGSRLWSSDVRRGEMQIPAAFVASRTSQGGEQGRRGGGSMLFIDLEPTTHASGRVGDVRLSYRLPGEAERQSDAVSLDYTGDPRAVLDDPYLSFTEMSERYAMYNMFLGFRKATQFAELNHDCAAAALIATRDSALAWDELHPGDPDIKADLVLLDQFLSNLREQGAVTDFASGADAIDRCNATGFPDGDLGNDHVMYGCASASRASGGWLLILGAALGAVLVRRRRRL